MIPLESSWPCSDPAPMTGLGPAEGITALAEAQALRGCGVGHMVEVSRAWGVTGLPSALQGVGSHQLTQSIFVSVPQAMEAMTTIMAIMMAMDLGQIDLEEVR